MSPSDLGSIIGAALALLGALITWWRIFGPRWRLIANGSVALEARVTNVENENEDLRAQLAACIKTREELREMTVEAVLARLNPKGEIP